MLLQNERIEINNQNKLGFTAFIMASSGGHKEIVQMLLQDKKCQRLEFEGSGSNLTPILRKNAKDSNSRDRVQM